MAVTTCFSERIGEPQIAWPCSRNQPWFRAAGLVGHFKAPLRVKISLRPCRTNNHWPVLHRPSHRNLKAVSSWFSVLMYKYQPHSDGCSSALLSFAMVRSSSTPTRLSFCEPPSPARSQQPVHECELYHKSYIVNDTSLAMAIFHITTFATSCWRTGETDLPTFAQRCLYRTRPPGRYASPRPR